MINDAYAPGFGPTNNNFLPTNQPTIVDLLDAKNVSWAWFAQNWNSAYSLRPNGLSTAHFAYHQSDNSAYCTLPSFHLRLLSYHIAQYHIRAHAN